MAGDVPKIVGFTGVMILNLRTSVEVSDRSHYRVRSGGAAYPSLDIDTVLVDTDQNPLSINPG